MANLAKPRFGTAASARLCAPHSVNASVQKYLEGVHVRKRDFGTCSRRAKAKIFAWLVVCFEEAYRYALSDKC